MPDLENDLEAPASFSAEATGDLIRLNNVKITSGNKLKETQACLHTLIKRKFLRPTSNGCEIRCYLVNVCTH